VANRHVVQRAGHREGVQRQQRAGCQQRLSDVAGVWVARRTRGRLELGLAWPRLGMADWQVQSVLRPLRGGVQPMVNVSEVASLQCLAVFASSPGVEMQVSHGRSPGIDWREGCCKVCETGPEFK
jgi:hypothetical protein